MPWNEQSMTRKQRRAVDMKCARVMKKLKKRAVYHKETGAKAYRVEDIAAALDMTMPQFAYALAYHGVLDAVSIPDMSDYREAH